MKAVARLKLTAGMAALILTVGAGVAFGASVTSESPLGTAGAGKQEVSLGDLVADAIRAALGADTAIVPASELKEKDGEIPKGRVSTQDVAAFVAYPDDPIVEVRMTGKQLRQALERSVLIYPQKNLGFLQVSGITFAFEAGKPQESRVTSVRVGGKTLSDDSTYSVGMTSSMANGALGYWKIWSKGDISRVTKTTIPEAVDKFFTGKSTINYSNLNRISGG